MNDELKTQLDKLVDVLGDQVKVYRSLLEIVRKEKDILISADLDDLNENNKSKEAMLLKARTLEAIRLRLASETSAALGLDAENPRLMDIANEAKGEHAERLRSLHSVLQLHVKRVQDYNRQNDVLVQSALENITGAMRAVRDNLQEKPTYKREGDVKGKAPSGSLVSREV